MSKICIVEDDAQIRVMLKETLELEGFAIVEAANGNEALRVLDAEAVDLVITDILMPEKEGLGLITELRKLHPGLAIFAISGGAPHMQAAGNLELATLFGACQAFHKPIDLDELIAAVRECVG